MTAAQRAQAEREHLEAVKREGNARQHARRIRNGTPRRGAYVRGNFAPLQRDDPWEVAEWRAEQAFARALAAQPSEVVKAPKPRRDVPELVMEAVREAAGR
jgi:hypothetical protein